MDGIREKLAFLTQRHGLKTGAALGAERALLDTQRAAGAFEAHAVLPGRVEEGDAGGFYLVQQDFPADHCQGSAPLGGALEAAGEQIALSASDAELNAFNPRATLFVDTETIGLAGGAGTVAFLVGAGYFTGDVFRVDQCFMRDFDDEEPMLGYLAELFQNHETIVGYNSKSFDLPLLRTRFVQHRIPFRLDGYMHYDLVHAVRRLWKPRLGDCSLGNVERKILELHRHGDVPGHFIPQRWFDYLRTRDARPLRGVFYHHQMDILSLASLTGLVARLLRTPGGGAFEHEQDRLALVQLHHRQKRFEEARELARRFLAAAESAPLRIEALRLLASSCKRLGDWDEMRDACTAILCEHPRDLDTRIELAKLYEHRLRDLGRAAACCRESIALFEERGSLNAAEAAAAFRKRLVRIERKMGGNRLIEE